MSCRKAAHLISVAMDRPLTGQERRSLRFHLLICSVCRRYRRQLAALREIVRRCAAQIVEVPAEPAPRLSAAARQRIGLALSRAR